MTWRSQMRQKETTTGKATLDSPPEARNCLVRLNAAVPTWLESRSDRADVWATGRWIGRPAKLRDGRLYDWHEDRLKSDLRRSLAGLRGRTGIWSTSYGGMGGLPGPASNDKRSERCSGENGGAESAATGSDKSDTVEVEAASEGKPEDDKSVGSKGRNGMGGVALVSANVEPTARQTNGKRGGNNPLDLPLDA